MLKASWGGGGRGMRVDPRSEAELEESASRSSAAARLRQHSDNDEVYLEKYWSSARATSRSRSSAIPTATWCTSFERDCSVQRRQSESGGTKHRRRNLDASDAQQSLYASPRCKLARAVGLRPTPVPSNSSMDRRYWTSSISSRSIRAFRSSTRSPKRSPASIIVKAQIRITQGAAIGSDETPACRCRIGNPPRAGMRLQCRVTTEDRGEQFHAGRTAGSTCIVSASGFGIRLDGGTAYARRGNYAVSTIRCW